jgi:hypothetical protein
MMMCEHLLEQIREYQAAELDFQNARGLVMSAVTLDDTKVPRAALRVALTKRDEIRVALMFHEGDHGCAAASAESH